MASISTKRTLQAAEKAMSLQPGNVQTPESLAQAKRWGLSGNTGQSMLPSDIFQLNEISEGRYPKTMTPDDIAYFKQIIAAFEEACR